MLSYAVLQLVGIAHQVGVVKAQHAQEVAHALHVVIDQLRLDGVPHLAAQQPAQLLRHREGAFDHRRPYVDLDIDVSAVQSLLQLDGHRSVAVRRLPRARIGRLLKGHAGHRAPAREVQRQC